MENTSEPQAPNSQLKLVFIIITVIVLCLASVLALYFYYKPKPLKQTIIPTDQSKLVFAQKLTASESFNPNLQTTLYDCPIASICQSDISFKNGSIQTNIAKGTKIYAAFDGNVENMLSSTPTNEQFKSILLTNLDKGLAGYYYYNGESVKSGQVLQGEVIATSSGQPIKVFDNHSFILQLIKLGKENNTFAILSNKEFKR